MQEKRMECVTSLQTRASQPWPGRSFLFSVLRQPALKKNITKTPGRLLSPLTKTPFTSLRGGKITFKGDDLCCVPVLNNCGGPTYRSPLDFFTCDQLFGLLEDDMLLFSETMTIDHLKMPQTNFFLARWRGSFPQKLAQLTQCCRRRWEGSDKPKMGIRYSSSSLCIARHMTRFMQAPSQDSLYLISIYKTQRSLESSSSCSGG